MTETDVRNAGMDQEAEEGFREMDWRLFQLVVAHEGDKQNSVCNVKFKTWKQMACCRQVSFLLESDTSSKHVRANVNSTEHTTRECKYGHKM